MNTWTPAAIAPAGPVLQRELAGNVLVLRPHRRLDGVPEFDITTETNDVLQILQQGQARHVLLDLANADYLSTAMIGAIVRVWKRVSIAGGRMALCQIADPVFQVLRATKLHTMWPIYPNRDEALRALGS